VTIEKKARSAGVTLQTEPPDGGGSHSGGETDLRTGSDLLEIELGGSPEDYG